MADDAEKDKADARYVLCGKDYELEYTVAQIMVVSSVGRERALAAYRHCCAVLPGIQPRIAFMECARNWLRRDDRRDDRRG